MSKAEYRSAQRSRRRIQQALADLLQEKPLDKITVTDIVRQADINRGTFYAHYENVPDVINRLVDEHCEIIKEALHGEVVKGNAPNPRAVLQEIMGMIQKDLDFYQKVLGSGAGHSIVEKMKTVIVDYLLEYEKDIKYMDHEHFLFTISFGAGGAINLYMDWFAGKLPLSLDVVTEKASDVLCTMLQVK